MYIMCIAPFSSPINKSRCVGSKTRLLLAVVDVGQVVEPSRVCSVGYTGTRGIFDGRAYILCYRSVGWRYRVRTEPCGGVLGRVLSAASIPYRTHHPCSPSNQCVIVVVGCWCVAGVA